MAELKDLPVGATINGTGVFDADGRYLGTRDEFDVSNILGASPTNDWTWGDVKRQNARNAQEVGAVGAAGALASLAQIGIGAIPTTTDTRNTKRIAELEGAEKAGKLGLTADERAQAEATVLTPARQLARQAQESTGSRLASAPTTSLASQAAFAQANQKAAQDAAVKGGIAINQANIEAKQRQVAELESRLRDKGEQDAARRDQVIGAIGDIAKMGGKLAAAQVQARGLSDKEIAYATSATGADGKPLYPAVYGMDPGEARGIMDKQKARDVYDAKQGYIEEQKRIKALKKQSAVKTSPVDYGDFNEAEDDMTTNVVV